MSRIARSALFSVCALLALSFAAIEVAEAAGQKARDPGPRPVATTPRPDICGHGSTTPFDPKPLATLTGDQLKLFCAGWDEFAKVNEVKGDGLGPTMNFVSCQGCHSYPQSGGSSPLGTNPQWAFAKSYPAGTNVVPWFVTENGPVREARFKKNSDGTPDGGVHDLFTITGLPGAGGCNLKQPDFDKERGNTIFRIPTPTFGGGLIEQIEDRAIVANQTEKVRMLYGAEKGNRGFSLPQGRLNIVRVGHTNGTENRNGNDGTVARFGWKAQNKSLLVFSGEAYNVEMGISNELFQTERDETPECQFHDVPNDVTNTKNLDDKILSGQLDDKVAVNDRVKAAQSATVATLSDVEKFSAFMRFLAPPEPSSDTPGGADSIARGREHFEHIGCAHCHTPELRTSAKSAIEALKNQPVRLYSDLALHKMGKLADGISQGQAGGSEFRSAPLWGLGQRVYFLHDGRTNDLVQAIEEHSSKGSSANPVILRYRKMNTGEQQDLLNFLRSL